MQGAGAGRFQVPDHSGLLPAEVFMMRLVPLLPAGPRLPDHKDLPETDGSIVQNFQEHPQAMILTGTMQPVLQRRHPDGRFAIGQDCGIYFRLTDPPLAGCKAPDWFYVPGVPPLLDGEVRRSYVLWQEHVPPLLLIEFVSGDGTEERDTTPETGRFWVYERVVQAQYYAIYEVDPGQVELFRLVDGRYQAVEANERGHYPVEELGVELGIWHGSYYNQELPWLRVWDLNGVLLPTAEEHAEAAHQHAEAAHQHAEAAHQRAEAAHQHAEAEHQRAEAAHQHAEAAHQRAEQEHLRAEAAHQRAEQEKQRAEREQHRAQRLAARLRALGIDPDAEDAPAGE
jgi:Uma2 family endonuclease